MAQSPLKPFQQPLLDLREELRRYRSKHHLSQSDFARRAATTQVTISRYENGDKVSDDIENRIRNLLIQELKFADGPAFTIEFEEIDGWHFGQFRFPVEQNGDLVRISKNSSAPQISTLICDATGSDEKAARTAELVDVAFGAAVGALSGVSISPGSIYRAVDASIRASRPYWGEAPSMSICIFERQGNYFSLLNAGMPFGLIFRGKDGTVSSVGNSRISPPGMQRSLQPALHESYRLTEEDVLLLYSDGFREELEKATSYKLESQLRSVARALRSDIRSIAMKLLRTLEMNSSAVSFKDNMSFFIARGK